LKLNFILIKVKNFKKYSTQKSLSMNSKTSDSNLNKVIDKYKFNGQKKFKLIVLFGLLGDFDSFEYAINLKNFIDK